MMASDEKKKATSWHISLLPETSELDRILVEFFAKEDPFYPYKKTTRIKHFLYNAILKEDEKIEQSKALENIEKKLDELEQTNRQILALLKSNTSRVFYAENAESPEDAQMKVIQREIEELDNMRDTL